MADYSAPRDVVRDFRFVTKDQEGGSQVDQYNWTDGLTHGQWPIVQFFTAPNGGGTEVTSQFVKDITADTIASASHKDPTATTGVWRKTQGEYFVRVKPNPALVYGTYYMRASFALTATQTRVEDFTAEITVPGDIDPNALITPSDVRVGFTTTLTDEQISPIIDAATDDVYGMLEDGGIADVDAYFLSIGGMPRTIKRAIIERTQCLILGYDLSSPGRVTEIQEGSERIKYSDGGYSKNVCENWAELVRSWLRRHAPGRKPMIKAVTKRVGHTVNDAGLIPSDTDPNYIEW